MLREKLVLLTENNAENNMCKMVNHLIQEKENFAIWGAGNTGRLALEYLQRVSKGKLYPQYIIDNNPALWNNGNVISPNEFFQLKNQPKVLLICVYVADQVVQQVKEAGYTGEVMVFSTLLLVDTEEVWSFYEKNMLAIEAVYDMLADDKSRETVENYLNSIKSGNVTYLEKINGDSRIKTLDPMILQYQEEIFADIGAFTGDTISEFVKLTNGNYKKIIGFELDKQNYDILKQTTSHMKNIILKNIAVGAESGIVHFVSGRSESSRISEQGDSEAEMTSLDHIPEMQNVTFIKISVCGMELDVLQGAENILRKNAPKLAVYTSGELLWKVPLYLKRIVPEYALYIRHYGCGTQGMVCYAVKGR